MDGVQGDPGPPSEDGDPRAPPGRLFEDSGLRVRRVTVTKRDGRPYLFVSADFDDVNRLAGTPAFPDLRARPAPGRRPAASRRDVAAAAGLAPGARADDGLMAVRFHLPSKVYEHRNAVDGVERGNIVAWRAGRARRPGRRHPRVRRADGPRSILLSTVGLFAGAVVLALVILAGAFWAVARKGRRDLESEAS